jgi:hypothetical protein
LRLYGPDAVALKPRMRFDGLVKTEEVFK